MSDDIIDAESVESPKEILEVSVSTLTPKQQRFIEAYKKNGDATKAAISAGYALKSAHVEGNRLLKNARILDELKHWRRAKAETITKNDFVDMALEDYRSLDVAEPNKPRFLDIAGKALGHLGGTGQTITNNTLNITNIDVKSLSVGDKWDSVRKLLE